MDELNIMSGFTKTILSKLAKMFVKKKFGCNADIQINKFQAAIADDKAMVHLDLDAELSKEELTKLLKGIGLL